MEQAGVYVSICVAVCERMEISDGGEVEHVGVAVTVLQLVKRRDRLMGTGWIMSKVLLLCM